MLGGGTSSATKGHGNDNTVQIAGTIKSGHLSHSRDIRAENVSGGIHRSETQHGLSLWEVFLLIIFMVIMAFIVPSPIPWHKFKFWQQKT